MKDRGTFVIFIVLILLAGVLLVKSFLPTSFLASKPSVSDDKIKLRLSGYGGYLEEEYMKEIKYEFEEMYPEVEVVLEISPTSYEDMQFKLVLYLGMNSIFSLILQQKTLPMFSTYPKEDLLYT